MVGLEVSLCGNGRLTLNSAIIGVRIDAIAAPPKVRGGHGYGDGGGLKWVFASGELTTAKRTTLESLIVHVSVTCGGGDL